MPYSPGGLGEGHQEGGLLSVASFREMVGPLARAAGTRLAEVLGVREDVATRLRRVHSPLDATAFRVRQLGWSSAALAAGAAMAGVLRPPAALAARPLLRAPLLAFPVTDQPLALAPAR